MRLILFLLLIFGFLMYKIIDPNSTDKQLLEKLNFDSTRVVIDTYESEGNKIRYVDIGNTTDRLVIFIHGTPGTLEAFNRYLKDRSLRSKFRMIAMDRPGYGASGPGTPETSIKKQADSIVPLLEKNQHNAKPIIVGHSFGATIAARLAMDHPDKIGTIILVGGALDPDHEKFFAIAKLLELPLIRHLIPASMKVANDEKNTHVDQLKQMLPGWKKITGKVIIIHGVKDKLVPIENAYFAEKVLTNAQVIMKIDKNAGHLIPWTKPDLIKNEILSQYR